MKIGAAKLTVLKYLDRFPDFSTAQVCTAGEKMGSFWPNIIIFNWSKLSKEDCPSMSGLFLMNRLTCSGLH